MTTYDMAMCAAERRKRAEYQLATELARLRSAISVPERPPLDAAQASWRQFIELDCIAASCGYKGGSIETFMRVSCEADAIEARALKLRQRADEELSP